MKGRAGKAHTRPQAGDNPLLSSGIFRRVPGFLILKSIGTQ
jgi:hypothetical protein